MCPQDVADGVAAQHVHQQRKGRLAGLHRAVGDGGIGSRTVRPACFADRFVAHVLDRHLDASSGLLRNVPGDDACNVGHGIEFVGFALNGEGPEVTFAEI